MDKITLIIFLVVVVAVLIVVLVMSIHAQVKAPEIKRVPAKANWDGVPKPDLTWEEVSRKVSGYIIPFTIPYNLTHCPKCGSKLLEYKSDFTVHEEGTKGQYDVAGEYCEHGCYTYLDCA